MIVRRTLRFGSLRIFLKTSQLNNGVLVISARDATAKGIALGVCVRDGSRYETPQTNGSRHLIEHMIFRGSKTVPIQKLFETIEFSGADLNAETDRDSVVFQFFAPSWKKALRLFPLFADSILNPAMKSEDIEKERKIVITELKRHTIDKPEEHAEENIYALLFPKSSVGLFIGGTEQSLMKIGLEYIRKTHQKYYTARRIIVAGAGLVQHTELVKLAERSFGNLPARRIRDHAKIEAVPTMGRKELEVIRESNEASYVLLGFNISSVLLKENEKDLCALKLIESVLGNGFASRLHKALRTELGIGYFIEARLDIRRTCCVFLIGLECYEHKDIVLAEAVIKKVVADLQETTIPSREIKGHIKQLRTKIRHDVDEPEKVREELLEKVLIDKPESIYSYYCDLPNITALDVRRVAKKYLDLNNYALVCIKGRN